MERPEGLGRGDPRRTQRLLVMRGAELGASRAVGSIADVGLIGRTEQAGGDRGVQRETGCARGGPADTQPHTAGPGDRAGHWLNTGKRRQGRQEQ